MRNKIITLFLSLMFCLILIEQSYAQNNNKYRTFFLNHFNMYGEHIKQTIMRFHKDDPFLKGTVFIKMEWENGKLTSASADSNTTGNKDFAKALIEIIKTWNIPSIIEKWNFILPFKTFLEGSNQPDFLEKGILTGEITDSEGYPVDKVRIILTCKDSTINSDTLYSNQEGIFIKTLITPGLWNLEFENDKYEPKIFRNVEFSKGTHLREYIKLQHRRRM